MMIMQANLIGGTYINSNSKHIHTFHLLPRWVLNGSELAAEKNVEGSYSAGIKKVE